MRVWVWAGAELVSVCVRVWVIPGVVSTVPRPVGVTVKRAAGACARV